MRKKLVCFITVFCLAFSANPAFAADLSSPQQEDATTWYAKIYAMSAHLNISDWGYATCSGMATIREGYNVRVTISLLKLQSGRWKSIKSWVHTGSGIKGVDVTDGYWVDRGTYMVETTAYVTDANGKYIESPSVTSVIREY